MKVLIAYYSRTGNTEKLAEKIRKELEKRGHEVKMEKVTCLEKHSFLSWWWKRIFKRSCKIKKINITNVSNFDLVCLGSPNWTGVSLPAKEYIKQLKGFSYKKSAFFATTYLSPMIEWMFFSGYLLETGFSSLIKKRKNIILSRLLLSCKVGKENNKGNIKKIKQFVDELEKTVISLKEYNLKQLDYDNAKMLVSFFLLVLLTSLVFIFVSLAFKSAFKILDFLFFVFFPGVISYFFLLLLIKNKRSVSLIKYVAGFLLIFNWVGIVFLNPFLLSEISALGLILIIAFMGIFREPLAVLSTGIFSLIAYLILFFFLPIKEALYPPIDGSFLLLTISVIILVSYREKKNYIAVLDAQEETEMARTTLEIKVAARVRELKELADSLDQQVKERTKELQERLNELEKFQRLMIGREEKMIELKEKIKKMEKELRVCQEKENNRQ